MSETALMVTEDGVQRVQAALLLSGPVVGATYGIWAFAGTPSTAGAATHAAIAGGTNGESASMRRPARRQKLGRTSCSQVSWAPVLCISLNAPIRPVTINAGAEMRAWYDANPNDPSGGKDDIAASAAAAGVITIEISSTSSRAAKPVLPLTSSVSPL